MIVSVPELKADLDRYLDLVGEEEIILTRDGKHIAKITPAVKDFGAFIRSLRGILPADATLEEARRERIAKHERHL